MDTAQIQDAFFQSLNRFRKLGFTSISGMTRGEYLLLNMLNKEHASHPNGKGMYVSEVAKRMHVTSPAVSRMLRGLERRELIERVVDRDDRRTTYIVLTKQGEQVRQRCSQRLQEYSNRVTQRMGEDDMETLIHLWNRLIDIMSEEMLE